MGFCDRFVSLSYFLIEVQANSFILSDRRGSILSRCLGGGGLIGCFHGGQLLCGGLIALLSLYCLGLGFIVVVGTGQDHDLIILAQTHDTDTGAVTALHRDLIGVQADDDALLAAQQHVIHIVHDLDRGDLVLGGIVVADALAARAVMR